MSTALDPTERPRTIAGGRRRGATGKPWKLLGFTCLALGLGLIGAGRFVPEAVELLAGAGLGGGTFAIAGLLMLGIATLHASVDAVRDSAHDDTPLIEQMAADVIDVRSSLDTLQSQGEDFAREVADVKAKVFEPPPPPPPPPQVPESALAHSDALFHLATSLDKLGARFDTRLATHHASLQEKLESLETRLGETVSDLESRLAEAAPAPALATEPNAGGAHEHAGAPEMPEMAEMSGAPEMPDAFARGSHEPSLGLLDTLGADVVNAPLPVRTMSLADAPAYRPTPEEPPQPGTWDEQMMVEPPPLPRASNDVADTQAKLGQLRALLSDDRLRAALESMRKQG